MRSGANAWRGSALYLDRPDWGTGTQFFTRKNGLVKPEAAYHLWAGSVGGPLVKSRTFFWASTEATTPGPVRPRPSRSPRRSSVQVIIHALKPLFTTR